MNYSRWYDKDPLIKDFMGLLKTLDSETVDVLAQDFIQTIMESGLIDTDSIILQLDKNAPKKYNRWYDKNYNLHTCIELLKNLDDTKKRIIIEKLKESFFHLVTDIYYERQNDEQ